jgi:hypothetical protein
LSQIIKPSEVGGLPSTVPTTFTTNGANATPALNELEIVGTGGVTTSGSGNTVTVTTIQAPTFSYYVTTTSAPVTGDGTIYTIGNLTEIIDTTSSMNAVTGVYTAPITGNYLFTYNMNIDYSSGHAYDGNNLFIMTTATTYQMENYFGENLGDGPNYTWTNTLIAPMTAGQTVSFQIQVNSVSSPKFVIVNGGAPSSSNCTTTLQGFLIR